MFVLSGNLSIESESFAQAGLSIWYKTLGGKYEWLQQYASREQAIEAIKKLDAARRSRKKFYRL